MKNLLAKKPKKLIKQGDIVKLGIHTLVCGDARDQNIIQSLIGKNKIQLILTDPPYGVNYISSKQGFRQFNHRHKDIKNDDLQSEEDYSNFTYEWLNRIKPYLSQKNSYYIFNSDKMLFSMRDGMVEAGYKLSQLLIWIKNQAVIGRLDYLPQHELIAYGWHGKHQLYKSKDRSVLQYPKPQKSTLHPTMKPIGLLRRLILNSSKINDAVFDPFGGSGSTLIACEQTKRKCFTVEVDPEYCATIIKRFEAVTSIKPIFLHK